MCIKNREGLRKEDVREGEECGVRRKETTKQIVLKNTIMKLNSL